MITFHPLNVCVAILLASAGLPALAQGDYPTKPVRILVGFPAGQAQDVLGRTVGQKLQVQMGRSFIVDNRPGAAGIIAAETAMGAPADGYTLLVSSSGPLAVNPGLYSKLPYDPIKSFAPVAGIAMVPEVLVTAFNFPATSVKELVALAKAKPGTINYASSGIGTTNHLLMEMFSGAAGIKVTHVPYKGGPPALADLVGGNINLMFETAVATLPLVKQGRIRALAVSSPKRVVAAPELPTVAELGYPGFSGVAWVVLVAPANTPPPIVAKLNAEINKALASSDVREQIINLGAEPMSMSPDELGAFMKSELVKWTKVVKESGAKVE